MALSKKADVTVAWQRLFVEMLINNCVVIVPQKPSVRSPLSAEPSQLAEVGEDEKSGSIISSSSEIQENLFILEPQS